MFMQISSFSLNLVLDLIFSIKSEDPVLLRPRSGVSWSVMACDVLRCFKNAFSVDKTRQERTILNFTADQWMIECSSRHLQIHVKTKRSELEWKSWNNYNCRKRMWWNFWRDFLFLSNYLGHWLHWGRAGCFCSTFHIFATHPKTTHSCKNVKIVQIL